MFPNINETLNSSSEVNALVSERIYRHGYAPQGVVYPYITWFVVNIEPENNLSSVPDIDKIPIQIDIWSNTDAGVVNLAKLVRSAIEPHAHMVNASNDERDEKTKLYRITLEFDWFLKRN